MDFSLGLIMVEQEENKKEEFAREFMTEEGRIYDRGRVER